jgi:hypothetical protein
MDPCQLVHFDEIEKVGNCRKPRLTLVLMTATSSKISLYENQDNRPDLLFSKDLCSRSCAAILGRSLFHFANHIQVYHALTIFDAFLVKVKVVLCEYFFQLSSAGLSPYDELLFQGISGKRSRVC